MTFPRKARDLLLCLAILAAPALLLELSGRQLTVLTPLDRALLRLSAPLQFLIASAGHGVGHFWDDYLALVDVKKENQRLLLENARLKAENLRLEQSADR